MLAIILITLVSALVSFFCSLAEASFYAITPSKIEELKQAGHKGGIRLAKLRENVDEPIAAILALNTIANSMGAALGGALVGMYFTGYASLASAIYGGLYTILILYFSEIIPKTLGVLYATKVAPAIATVILMLIQIFRPIIWSSQILTRQLRHDQDQTNASTAPSEKEILALAELGVQAGTLLPDEARLAVNALRLNDVTAKELMTPRTVVYMLPSDLPLSRVTEKSEHWSYSRLPIVQNNNPDKVEGIVHRREVFDVLVEKEEDELGDTKLIDLAHEAVFVPETIKCNELLKLFIDNRQHLIVVTNEYGGMEGVISLEDVVEFILGVEIVDPHDKHTDMQEFARRQAMRRLKRVQAGALEPHGAEDPSTDAIPRLTPPQQ